MLDDQATYQTYDKTSIGKELANLSSQFQTAWSGTRQMEIPEHYQDVTSIVIIGMGGSALGPHILSSCMADIIDVPITITRGYTPPGSINKDTLVILSSFSGSTEEVLAAAEDLKTKECLLVAITTGGALAEFANTENIPLYQFDPGALKHSPRLGTGFSLMGVTGILERIGKINFTESHLEAITTAADEVAKTCAPDIKTDQNPAKQLAQSLKDRALLITAADHLTGNAHVLTNQINETAKQYAVYHEIPELNHHLMEGLSHPKDFFQNFTVLSIESDLYHPRNTRRVDLTKEVFQKQGATIQAYKPTATSKKAQVAELLSFSGYLSYYMAMQNQVEPESIPFVDWFKKELKK